MANQIIFLRGNSNDIPTIKDGQLLFTIDEGKIYVDNGTTRVEFYKQEIDKLITSISDAKKAGTDAQSSVNTLAGKVGTVPEGKTVIELITDSEYDDTAIKNRISANETAIGTLTGTGDGSVKKTVADEIAKVVADAPEAFDTLKEISDWIATHGTDATAMNTQINANKTSIETLNGADTVTGSVANTVKSAIDALDYTLTATDGKYISAISQIDGVISATQADLPVLSWKTFAEVAQS